MQLVKEPYFMSNEDWYYYDRKEHKLKLTDKAPPEAVKDYEEHYEMMKKSRFMDDE